jgi:hypothetical protein
MNLLKGAVDLLRLFYCSIRIISIYSHHYILDVAEQLLEPFWQSAYFLFNGFAMVALLCLAGFKSK